MNDSYASQIATELARIRHVLEQIASRLSTLSSAVRK